MYCFKDIRRTDEPVCLGFGLIAGEVYHKERRSKDGFLGIDRSKSTRIAEE